MALCRFGSEKKFEGDSTIVINPYEGLNAAAQAFLVLAAVPPQFDFDADSICSFEPPDYQPIDFLELTIPPIVYAKTENNARRAAWFKGCKCKSPPPPPDPDPDETPPPPDAPPDALPHAPYPPFSCDGREPNSSWIQYKGYVGGDGQNPITFGYRFGTVSTTQSISVARREQGNQEWYVFVDGFPSSPVAPNTGIVVTDARYIECFEPEPEPEPDEPPPFPEICPPPETGTECRFQSEQSTIISTLQLWTSESNNRIRDEIIARVDEIQTAQIADANEKTVYLAGLLSTLDENARLYRDDVKLRILEARNDTITGLKDWIDEAKIQTIAAIGASAASILAGLVASTTTITTAITAATATITGAITTATTTLTTAVNAARDNVKERIQDAEDKIVEDLTKEIEKGRYRYRVLILDITSFPSGLSYTVGRNGAPDKYSFGWIQWKRVASGENVAYTERQFICNVKGVFVSPFPNEDVTAVVHLLPSVTATSMLIWSNNEFRE